MDDKRPMIPARPRREINGSAVKAPGSYLQRRGTVVSRPKLPAAQDDLKIAVDDFEILKVLGRGGFGTVYLARKNDTKELVALKKMKKSRIAARNKAQEIKNERDVMVQNERSPWLVQMVYSFQNESDLFIAMEYMPGGDLCALLSNLGCLSVQHAKMYAAEMILAVHCLHQLGFIHRDLKPANFLIDKQGHLKLGDFGLSKVGFTQRYRNTMRMSMNFMALGITSIDQINQLGGVQTGSHLGDFRARKSSFLVKKAEPEPQHEVVGSPDYIAVEVIRGEGYTFAVDWWSVGVIIYEMIAGIPPFYADEVTEVFQNILDYQNVLQFPSELDEDGNEIIEMTPEAWKLVTSLICEPTNRLGFSEISEHPFFETLDWHNLRRSEPPFVPELSGDTDTSYFQPPPEEAEDAQDNDDISKPLEAFLGFTFCRPMAEMKPLLASLAAAVPPAAPPSPTLTPAVKSNSTGAVAALPADLQSSKQIIPSPPSFTPQRPRAGAETSKSQSPSTSRAPSKSTPVPVQSSKPIPTPTATFLSKLSKIDNLPDHSYLNDFLDSFRKFTTPRELFDSLQSRYSYLPPTTATPSEVEEYNLWRGPVQLRVINVLKKWIERYYEDFANDQLLLKDLDSFLLSTMSQSLPGSVWAPRIADLLIEKKTVWKQLSESSKVKLVSSANNVSLSPNIKKAEKRVSMKTSLLKFL